MTALQPTLPPDTQPGDRWYLHLPDAGRALFEAIIYEPEHGARELLDAAGYANRFNQIPYMVIRGRFFIRPNPLGMRGPDKEMFKLLTADKKHIEQAVLPIVEGKLRDVTIRLGRLYDAVALLYRDHLRGGVTDAQTEEALGVVSTLARQTNTAVGKVGDIGLPSTSETARTLAAMQQRLEDLKVALSQPDNLNSRLMTLSWVAFPTKMIGAYLLAVKHPAESCTHLALNSRNAKLRATVTGYDPPASRTAKRHRKPSSL